jgi:hypothetical protein
MVDHLKNASDGVSGLSKDMERLAGKEAAFKTLKDVAGIFTYLPEKAASIYHGSEQKSSVTTYLEEKIARLEELQNELAEEEAKNMLTDSAYEKMYGTPRPEKPAPEMNAFEAAQRAEMEKTAQSYIDKYNPVLVLQQKQIEISKLAADGLIDETTALKALADVQNEYNEALTSPAQKGVQDKLRAMEFELSLIGKTNDARERAIDLMEFEKDAYSAYGQEADKYVRDYEEKLMRLERARDLEDIADSISVSFTNLFKTLTSGCEDTAEAFRNLGREIVASVMQKAIFDPFSTALSAGLSSLFIGASGGLAGNQSAISGAGGLSANANNFSNFMASALGNAFHHGRIMAFANGGIFDRPTLFPMRNGMGLMGEAGPEAVMPLRRGTDGRLGVSGGSQPLNIKVVNSIDSDTLSDALSTKSGERVIMNIIKRNRGSIGGMLG